VDIISNATEAVNPGVIQHGLDVVFRHGNIDAGPHPDPEDEDGDNEPGLQFINPPDDEMQQ
jgi:hypothetical protein